MTKRFGKILLSSFASVLALLIPQQAGATSIFYVLQGPSSHLEDIIYGVDSLAPIGFSDIYATGYGNSSAQVTHGSLGLYGEASGFGDINSSLAFTDRLTLVSATLPAGTLVQLAATYSLAYGFNVQGCALGVGEARITAALGVGANHFQSDLDACAFPSSIGDPNENNFSDSFAVTQLFQFHIGDVVDLGAQLNVTADAGNCCIGGYARVDAFHTMNFFIDPVGTDFTYTSESGAPYFSPTASPVPEPASMLLFGSGLLAIARRRFKKRV